MRQAYRRDGYGRLRRNDRADCGTVHARPARPVGSLRASWKPDLQRYRELVDKQISPRLGQVRLQKLTTLDIERWHASLLTSGHKGGQRGVSTRTIRHAHTLLKQMLAEAMKHGLVVRNVAAVQSQLRAMRSRSSARTDSRNSLPDSTGMLCTPKQHLRCSPDSEGAS